MLSSLSSRAELTPKHDEKDGTENKQVQSLSEVKTVTVDAPASTQSQKPTMVGESFIIYGRKAYVERCVDFPRYKL